MRSAPTIRKPTMNHGTSSCTAGRPRFGRAKQNLPADIDAGTPDRSGLPKRADQDAKQNGADKRFEVRFAREPHLHRLQQNGEDGHGDAEQEARKEASDAVKQGEAPRRVESAAKDACGRPQTCTLSNAFRARARPSIRSMMGRG